MTRIGIDLGTTTSLAAVYREGRVQLIPNKYGSFVTPSVVSLLEDGSVAVGELARERLITHPDRTAASFKKDMGTSRSYNLGDVRYTAEELSSFVIKSILEDARDFLQEEIEEVIISVPAYFHDKQRVATKKAGLLAGVSVRRLINEPSAAALAAYLNQQKEKLFLVFDFGGGTLDISIVDCFDNMVEILSVSGDNRLGGDDFNRVIAESFLGEHGLQKKDLSDKEYSIVLKQAETCKKLLTDQERVTMAWNRGEQDYRSIFDTDRLIDDGAEIFAKIKNVIAHALRDGNFTTEDIDAIVLAGGSSQMPAVQAFLRHLFGEVEIVFDHAPELIARGLGNVAGIVERDADIKDFILSDICPFTLGTAVNNEADPANPYTSAIIPRNTVLPSSRERRFWTSVPMQELISCEILQGENPYAKDNLCLGEIEMPVRRRPAGEEAVDIRFTYDIDGILEVEVTSVTTGECRRKVISEGFSEDELARRIRELREVKTAGRDRAEDELLLEKLRSLYETGTPDIREHLFHMIQNLELLMKGENHRALRRYRAYLHRVMVSLEEYDPFVTSRQMWHEDYSEEDYEEEDSDRDEDDRTEGGNVWTS